MRIKKRAQEKIAEALEEERLERLGPGGLDPAEVKTFKGLFASISRKMKGGGVRLTSNQIRYQSLLILLLSVASIRRNS